MLWTTQACRCTSASFEVRAAHQDLCERLLMILMPTPVTKPQSSVQSDLSASNQAQQSATKRYTAYEENNRKILYSHDRDQDHSDSSKVP
ncbi:hypothetical protein SAMD00019534_125050, partial [Acytostelium subglobosum LB1]|uniref:hypothetical protein n=1 Tax=Acytostelium subglobosum LB1 TaxID=1410327 RepID=UPI0006448E55